LRGLQIAKRGAADPLPTRWRRLRPVTERAAGARGRRCRVDFSRTRSTHTQGARKAKPERNLRCRTHSSSTISPTPSCANVCSKRRSRRSWLSSQPRSAPARSTTCQHSSVSRLPAGFVASPCDETALQIGSRCSPALLLRGSDSHGTPSHHFPARRSQPRRHALGFRQPRRLPPHSSLAKEVAMSVSVLYMAMSLDGYIAGPNDEPDNPGGDGFMRLHEWFLGPDGEFARPSGPAGELYDEVMDAPGAVLAGRRTVEQVDHWGGDHHGRPIFVPSQRPPGPSVANYPVGSDVFEGVRGSLGAADAAAR